jgi:hypothetical protein
MDWLRDVIGRERVWFVEEKNEVERRRSSKVLRK